MKNMLFILLLQLISICNCKWSLLKLYAIHYGSFLYFFVFNLINIFVIMAQKLQWKLYGIQYENSAHVKTVLASCKPCPMDKVRSRFNFITWHHSFQHPSYVLSDNVILSEVNKSTAIFVELPHSIDHYSVTKAPFLFTTLVHEAKRIIEIPLESFHCLAAEFAPSNIDDVTFMFNSARCGSTLVAKIVELADQRRESLILSEPPILMDMYIMKSVLPPDEYRKLLQDTIRFLLKPCSMKRKIFIKTTYFVIKIASDIQELFPKASMYYCHRDPLRTVIAHERAFGMSLLYQVLRFVMMLKKWDVFSRFVGFQRNPPVGISANMNLKSTMFELCSVIWADNYVTYLNLSKILKFPDLFYDDVFENPEQFCKKVLSLNGIDLCYLPQAMDALRSDSQEGTFVGQKMLKHIKHTELSCDLQNRVNEFCNQLKLPNFQWENVKKKNL